MENNPLINILNEDLIPYEKIKNEHYKEAFEYSIKKAKSDIEKILEKYPFSMFNENVSFEDSFNFMKDFEKATDMFDEIKIIYNNKIRLDSLNEENLKKEEITEIINDFENWIYTNIEIYKRIERISLNNEMLEKNKELKSVINFHKRKFNENCILQEELNEEQIKKIQKLKEINKEYSSLIAIYEKNLIEATNNFHMNIKDENIIKDFPGTVKEQAKKLSKEKGYEEGYCFDLSAPSYSSFMMHCPDRKLRKEMYSKFNSKCLFKEDKFYNVDIMKKIIKLRQEKAKLIGYQDFNSYVLSNRMAKNEKEVEDFLISFKEKVLKKEKKEYNEIYEFSGLKDNKNEEDKIMQRWDLSFYKDKLMKKKFNINSEELRKYFPLEKVFQVVFELIENLYGIIIKREKDIKLYHPDVKVFSMNDKNGLLGYFYCDLFPRKEKTMGGWVYALKPKVLNKIPIVGINANNRPPNNKGEVFCSLYECETIFHELGHALHIILSETKFKSITGINVLWDFVECPSQMNENFFYEKYILRKFDIDEETINKILVYKDYLNGINYSGQIYYSILDLKLHSTEFKDDMELEEFETKYYDSIFPKLKGIAHTCSFSHLFNATYDYSCGYYSYLWAETLALDAYDEFKEGKEKDAAERFRKYILSKGGSEDPNILFFNFKGRKFNNEAFLKAKGLL